VTLALTSTLMIVEVVGGVISGSLALLADAGHMLTDSLALGVAYLSLVLSSKPADARRTYGYRRLEILGAMFNGMALMGVGGSIVYEAVQRWVHPTEIDVRTMAAVAAVGLLVNVGGLTILSGERGNISVRGAFLHVLGDTLGSAGVLLGGGVIALTGWSRADVVVSLGIALLIVVSSLGLLREVFDVLLESAPRHIDTEAVRQSICDVPGVDGVHDLHIWSITSGLPALSAHVVVLDRNHESHAILSAVGERLRTLFGIDHTTLQIERQPNDPCGCQVAE
jgi:cobalt-zinc-cadmium efflux system protein